MRIIEFGTNITDRIKTLYYKWKYKNYYQEIDDTYEFIWGIKSGDDISSVKEANNYTMNDFDVIYDKNKKIYLMSVETIYMFSNGLESEKKYVQSILDKFTGWMNSKEYDTTKGLSLWDVFTDGKNITTEFESIEELYSCFKFLVIGYVNS